MKITYFHQYFNTLDMPGGTRSYEMAKRLVMMGHEVNVVTSWRESVARNHWFETCESGIRVHWLPVLYSNHMTFWSRIRAFFKFAIFSAFYAASIDADIVFATSTPLTIALPAIYAARRRKIPMVFEVRDLWPEMPIAVGVLKNPVLIRLSRILESFAYRNSSSIIALSPGMKNGVIRSGYPSSRIAVIPNSCDNTHFSFAHDDGDSFRKSRPWLGSNPLLIYAGTFGKVNGLEYAVDLAIKLYSINSNIRILLVGDGAQHDFIKRKANQLGVLNKNLFILGQLSKKEIPALFASATMSSSFFVDLPEMQVNSANKFFDSLAAGKPVLLNYGGWMHDLVLKHECGYAAWQIPLDKVAIDLDHYLNDRDWLAKASQSARDLALNYFDRDFLAEKLERILVANMNQDYNSVESIAPGVYF